MIDTLMRDADPAATLSPDPMSAEGTELLTRILAHPRPRRRHLPLPRMSRPVRRAVVCSLVGAAALTVALVVPLPWRGSAGLGSAAYAVSSEQDGSTRVAVRWSDLVDPARLQADLDRAGAPVRILTGTVYPIGEQHAVPACAQPTHGGPYDSRAVEWDLPTGSDLNGFVIRPKYFPPGGTLVIEVFFRAGQRKLDGSMSYMVVGSPPTCAQPVYSVASDGAGAR